ncbi:hypothetical protein EDD16DRAFT_1238608 [Pisolithus croceorrhizus]|nr:hypothetical protein EDD16DRAFT_1238608 [Pisolithus croceorrhizus]
MSDRRAYHYPSDPSRSSQWSGSTQPPPQYPPQTNVDPRSYHPPYPTLSAQMTSPPNPSVPYGTHHQVRGPVPGHQGVACPAQPPAQYPQASPSPYAPRQSYPSPPDRRIPVRNDTPQYPTSHSYHHPASPSQPSSHAPTPYFQQPPQYPASPARPYSCDLCALSFNRQHDLKRHRETHSGEKPFSCNGGCGKTFTRKDALKRHQLVKQCGRDEDL